MPYYTQEGGAASTVLTELGQLQALNKYKKAVSAIAVALY